MAVADPYELLDSGGFRKLEQVGPYRLIRPSAQALWSPRHPDLWSEADGEFLRFSGGDGRWEFRRKVPESWEVSVAGRTMVIKTTDFGHLGLFAEQADNWDRIGAALAACPDRAELSVLNLFAYTGGSTLAVAAAGAKAVHLDASKTSVAWGRENADAAGLGEAPVRWIVDDVQKFVAREVRRASKYHGIILDPPSYGRGPKGQGWKIEDDLVPLLRELRTILADDAAFVILSAHSPGHTPLALENLLREMDLPEGTFESHEMVIREKGADGRALPSGASSMYRRTR